MNRSEQRHLLLLAVAVWFLAGISAEAKSISIDVGEKTVLRIFETKAWGVLLSSRAGTHDYAKKAEPYGCETALGRAYWPSRDPIGERGGSNKYGFRPPPSHPRCSGPELAKAIS